MLCFGFLLLKMSLSKWIIECCLLNNVGVGGYTYLLEPLWWAGMVTSKCSTADIFVLPCQTLRV